MRPQTQPNPQAAPQIPYFPAARLARGGPKRVSAGGRVFHREPGNAEKVELRDVRGPVPSQRFAFDSPLLDAVSAAFHDDARVQVDGRASPVRRLAYAVHVSRVALPALAD